MKNTVRRISLVAMLSLSLPVAWAAPVAVVSNPGVYVAPSASELADATSFLLSVPGIPAGSIITELRNPPATLINTGLDSAAPAIGLNNQNIEVGVIPLPSIADVCPDNTPVTITISEWEIEQIARTFPGTLAFGVGTVIVDSRDPTVSAAVSMNTRSAPVDVELPGSHIAPSQSMMVTLADLPFYTFISGIEVAKVVDVAMVLEVAQASWDIIDTPTITLEYDNEMCSFIANTKPVPVMGHSQLALLLAMLLGVGLVFRRRLPV